MSDRMLWWLFRAFFWVMVLFLMAPVVVVVMASVSETSYLTIPPQGFTLHWYGEVFNQPSYRRAFLFSLQLAVASVVLSLLMGMSCAYALVRYSRPVYDVPLSSFLMSPLIFPGVVVGVALLRLYAPAGLLGSFWALLAAHGVITAPYTVRCILSSLSRDHLIIEEAAITLGASRLTAFITVTFPLITPGIFAAAIMAFVISFDNVPVTIFILGVRQETIPVRIFNQLEYGSDPSVAAVSTLLIIGTAVALVIAERLVKFHRFV